MEKGKVVLVTGGAGFLGSHIVRLLLGKCDSTEVSRIRVFDLVDFDCGSLVEQNPLCQIEVESVVGDVWNYEAVKRACDSVDVVIHCAGIVDLGDKPGELLQAINVGGTENVIRACKEKGVNHLIYTSTQDVVVTKRPLNDVSETDIYPPEGDLLYGNYGVTKQRAEKLVLAANGSDGLVTCSLRPVVMFGEGDPFNVTVALSMACCQKVVIPVDADNQFSNCYVRNVAWAHVCALRAVISRPHEIGGRAYFVTDDSPSCPYYDFLKPFADGLGYQYAPFKLPGLLLVGLVWMMELVIWIVSPLLRLKPLMRSAPLHGALTTCTFSRQRAEEELQYKPLFDFQESVRLSLPFYRRVLKG